MELCSYWINKLHRIFISDYHASVLFTICSPGEPTFQEEFHFCVWVSWSWLDSIKLQKLGYSVVLQVSINSLQVKGCDQVLWRGANADNKQPKQFSAEQQVQSGSKTQFIQGDTFLGEWSVGSQKWQPITVLAGQRPTNYKSGDMCTHAGPSHYR